MTNFRPSDFVSFYDFDPTLDRRCIYMTLKRERCKLSCKPEDRVKACKLYIRFTTTAELPSLEEVQEYARLNCCQVSRVWHQDRIVDRENLAPLAERWLDEIRLRMAKKTVQLSARTASTIATKGVAQAKLFESTRTAVISPSPTSITSPDKPPSTNSPSSPVLTQSTPRYNLRSLQVAGFAGQSNAPAPLPQFTEYVSDPRVNVASLFRRSCRNFKSGWLYAFDRTSSPGLVKIGMTTISVEERLKRWAKCGGEPRLVHSSNFISHVKRVEALVHYELVRERRREEGCQPCNSAHVEWFETSREKAIQVIGSWARLFATADPYNGDGKLKDVWVRALDGLCKDGEAVTAEGLLTRYALLLANNSVVSVQTIAPEQKPGHPSVPSSEAPTPSCPRPQPVLKPFQSRYQNTQLVSALTLVQSGKTASPGRSARASTLAVPRPAHPDGFGPGLAPVEAFALKYPLSEVLEEVLQELKRLTEAQRVLLPPLPPLKPVLSNSKILNSPLLAT